MKSNLIIFFIILSASCSLGTISTTSSKRDVASLNQQEDCRDIARAFIASNPVKSGPIIQGERSYGSKIPNFDSFRDTMLKKRPSLDKFNQRFTQENGRAPNVKEALTFLRDSHRDLSSHLRSAKGIDEQLDQYLEMAAAKIEYSPSHTQKVEKYLTDSEYRNILTKSFDTGDNEQRQLYDSLGWTNYKGHLGELDVLLRLEDLQAQGVYLTHQNLLSDSAQEINDIFSSSLQRKIDSVTAADVPRLKEQFPKVFKDNGEDSNEVILEKAITFLETKEFDLIVKKHGRYSIVEVKNYKHPISMSDMRVDSGRKKTILDQQLETIDILKFLELEERVYPTVAFLRGVKPDARAKLESHGVSVLADVIE